MHAHPCSWAFLGTVKVAILHQSMPNRHKRGAVGLRMCSLLLQAVNSCDCFLCPKVLSLQARCATTQLGCRVRAGTICASCTRDVGAMLACHVTGTSSALLTALMRQLS